MGQALGYVLAVLYPVLAVILSVIIYLKREHSYIRCRNPEFLIVQNIGSAICCVFNATYITLRPDYSCVLFFGTFVLNFALYGAPLLLRTWEYCVNFHISTLRQHYRSFFSTHHVHHPPKTSWFVEHKRVSSPPFMRRFMVLLALFFASFDLLLLLPVKYSYSPSTHGCEQPGVSGIYYALVGFVIGIICFAIFCGFLLRRANDVYKFKRELFFIGVFWTAVLVTFFAYSLQEDTAQQQFSSIYIIVIGYYVTLIVSNLVPLGYVMNFDRHAGKEGTLSYFTKLLHSVQFRNAFYAFLAEHHCQEHLQFYEVVIEWKALHHNDPTYAEKARSIASVFIAETGVCQVNITGHCRNKVMMQVERDPIPRDVFDDAFQAIIVDLHMNSFREYSIKNPGTIFLDSSSVEVPIEPDARSSTSSLSDVPLRGVDAVTIEL